MIDESSLETVETAIAVELLAAARAMGRPGGETEAATYIAAIAHPDWMVLATAGGLVRSIAGRVGNSPDDRTDDPVGADTLLDECQRATWWGRRNKTVKPTTADVMTGVLMLARSENRRSRADLAKRWIGQHSTFDALHLTHAAAQLVRYLVGPTTATGGGDDADRLLDTLSVELLEATLGESR
jgi:hypothetical protein